MNDRGHYGSRRTAGSPHAHVGISLFHTVGDRDRAVEKMNTEFNVLVNELYREMGVTDYPSIDFAKMTDPKYLADFRAKATAADARMKGSPLYPIWRDVVSPMLKEWRSFYHDQSSWEEFKTSWETYENWDTRIKGMRSRVEDEIRKHGGEMLAPSSADLPGTIWQDAGSAVSSGAGSVLTIIKYGVIGVLGIGAVVALSSVASNLKRGRDPAMPYAEIYRGRKRSAA